MLWGAGWVLLLPAFSAFSASLMTIGHYLSWAPLVPIGCSPPGR